MSAPTLVTGAQGFVGRYLVAALLARGERVVGVGRSARQDDRFTHRIEHGADAIAAPLPEGLGAIGSSRGYSYHRCDLADPDAVRATMRSVRPARIVHLAAALRDEPDDRLARSNVDATRHLAAAAAALHPRPLFVLGSSGAVLGNQPAFPVREDAVPEPVGSYARSKLAAERAALAIAQAEGMALVVARLFNLLGPGLQTRHLPAYLAHRIAAIEAGACPPTIEVGDLTPTRDLVDVRDAARFLVDFAPRSPATVAHVASGAETAMERLAALFASRARCAVAFRTVAARSRAGADRMVAEIGHMARLGLPRIGLERSVDAMLDYARAVQAATVRR